MYYLGIDGGGTKTRYLLINDKLEKIYDGESSTIHVHQVGIDGLKNEITTNITKACKKANIKTKDISFVFAGVPCYGESK